MSKYTKCLIRAKRVLCTPEERVRQSLLKYMICELGFPKGLISVEKKIGLRRYDIVSFTKEIKPLLLIECKAKKLSPAALRQVFGYNSQLFAPFISVVAEGKMKTFWKEKGKVVSVSFIPKFQELYEFSRRF